MAVPLILVGGFLADQLANDGNVTKWSAATLGQTINKLAGNTTDPKAQGNAKLLGEFQKLHAQGNVVYFNETAGFLYDVTSGNRYIIDADGNVGIVSALPQAANKKPGKPVFVDVPMLNNGGITGFLQGVGDSFSGKRPGAVLLDNDRVTISTLSNTIRSTNTSVRDLNRITAEADTQFAKIATLRQKDFDSLVKKDTSTAVPPGFNPDIFYNATGIQKPNIPSFTPEKEFGAICTFLSQGKLTEQERINLPQAFEDIVTDFGGKIKTKPEAPKINLSNTQNTGAPVVAAGAATVGGTGAAPAAAPAPTPPATNTTVNTVVDKGKGIMSNVGDYFGGLLSWGKQNTGQALMMAALGVAGYAGISALTSKDAAGKHSGFTLGNICLIGLIGAAFAFIGGGNGFNRAVTGQHPTGLSPQLGLDNNVPRLS